LTVGRLSKTFEKNVTLVFFTAELRSPAAKKMLELVLAIYTGSFLSLLGMGNPYHRGAG
jgi:hypothetical protein